MESTHTLNLEEIVCRKNTMGVLEGGKVAYKIMRRFYLFLNNRFYDPYMCIINNTECRKSTHYKS